MRPLYEAAMTVVALGLLTLLARWYVGYRAREGEDKWNHIWWLVWWAMVFVAILAVLGMTAVGVVVP